MKNTMAIFDKQLKIKLHGMRIGELHLISPVFL